MIPMIWSIFQCRYLSLLLTSYQESELLSLSRLARMSGSRWGFVFVLLLVVVVIAVKVNVVVFVAPVVWIDISDILHQCSSRKMLVADVPPPEGSNIRFRWVEIMDSKWTKRLWLSLTLIMPQGGGARHGGRQQDAVPREKVAIVTQFLSPPSMIIFITNSNDHLHINSL